MTKGEDGLYTGVLILPKGTRFDLKILKNPTVDRLIWSATRYASVLNSDGAYDFGEFTDNLVPNGDFEGVEAQWTPADSIVARDNAHGAGWTPASGEFKTGGSPARACVVCTGYDSTTFAFDDIAIVSP